MSAPAFTPGPWLAQIHGDSEMGDTFFVSYANDEGFGPSLLEGGLVLADDKENEANAHLIAAAPELYDLLAELMNWPSIRAAIGSEFEARAKAILAKARGEP